MANVETRPVAKRDRHVTSSGEVYPSDDILSVATAGGAVTLTLPLAANVRGRVFDFNKADSSANNLTVQVQGSDTWDGGSSRTWNTQYQGYGIAAVEVSPNVFGYVTIFSYGDAPTFPATLTLVEKTASESITSDNTLSDDDTLVFSVEANKKYFFRFTVFYDTAATPGFQYQINGPASPTVFRCKTVNIAASFAAFENVGVVTTYQTRITTAGGTTGGYVMCEGVLHNGSNAGTLAFRWSQQVSNASQTTVLAGSLLEYSEIV